jgi:GDP-L-fucose synthase
MTEPATPYDVAGKRVWVAGHRGMVGAAIVRRLEHERVDLVTVGRDRVDLRRQADVEAWMADARPQAVFVAAATVGGILANDARPGEFLYDNLMIEANIIEASRRSDVEKLLFLGSSCIYPRLASQPMAEDALLTGPLEPTNQWYAVAKIAGIKLCQAYRRQYGCDFISAMPTNLYGVGDNFDLASSHVLPALIAKMHAAKVSGADEVVIWGTGRPRREFLYVDDCADALVHLMKVYSGEDHINVGTGEDIAIAELARLIAGIVGFQGRISQDLDKPDGMPRKLLDISRIKGLGWAPKTSLEDGIRQVYAWYVKSVAAVA